MGPGGVLAEALQDYYDPMPPRPTRGLLLLPEREPAELDQLQPEQQLDQYTNWDQGIGQAGTAGAELLVFVTDGDPTAYDLDKAGDPLTVTTSPLNTDRDRRPRSRSTGRSRRRTRSSADTRVLAVGVGSALNNTASRNRLVQVSGPQVVRDADLALIDDLNDIDVALVTNFDDLAAFMRSSCSSCARRP